MILRVTSIRQLSHLLCVVYLQVVVGHGFPQVQWILSFFISLKTVPICIYSLCFMLFSSDKYVDMCWISFSCYVSLLCKLVDGICFSTLQPRSNRLLDLRYLYRKCSGVLYSLLLPVQIITTSRDHVTCQSSKHHHFLCVPNMRTKFPKIYHFGTQSPVLVLF